MFCICISALNHGWSRVHGRCMRTAGQQIAPLTTKGRDNKVFVSKSSGCAFHDERFALSRSKTTMFFHADGTYIFVCSSKIQASHIASCVNKPGLPWLLLEERSSFRRLLPFCHSCKTVYILQTGLQHREALSRSQLDQDHQQNAGPASTSQPERYDITEPHESRDRHDMTCICSFNTCLAC